MRKIIILLLVLMTFGANAQRIQKINNYGYAYNRFGVDTLFYLPSDTFSVPAFYQSYPFMAKKGSNLYLWNTSTFIWELLSGGGGSYTFPYSVKDVSGAVQLENDTTANPTNYFYGRNSAGRRGWYPQSGITGVNLYNSNGTLTGNRAVNGGGYDFVLGNTNQIQLSGSASTLTMDNGVQLDGQTQVSLRAYSGITASAIIIALDSILVEPNLGNLKIDTLNYTLSTTGKKILVRDTATGLVENIDPALIGGGGSTDTTSLSNRINQRIPYDNSFKWVKLSDSVSLWGVDGAELVYLPNQDSLMLLGGWHRDSTPASRKHIYKYNADMSFSRRLPDAPWTNGLHCFGQHYQNDTIYVWGGDAENPAVQEFWSFKVSTETWTLIRSSIVSSRASYADAWIDNEAFMIGGVYPSTTDSTNAATEIVKGKPDGTAWSTVQTGLVKFGGIYSGSGVYFNGYLYMIAGVGYATLEANRNYKVSVWRSADKGVTWEQRADVPFQKSGYFGTGKGFIKLKPNYDGTRLGLFFGYQRVPVVGIVDYGECLYMDVNENWFILPAIPKTAKYDNTNMRNRHAAAVTATPDGGWIVATGYHQSNPVMNNDAWKVTPIDGKLQQGGNYLGQTIKIGSRDSNMVQIIMQDTAIVVHKRDSTNFYNERINIQEVKQGLTSGSAVMIALRARSSGTAIRFKPVYHLNNDSATFTYQSPSGGYAGGFQMYGVGTGTFNMYKSGRMKWSYAGDNGESTTAPYTFKSASSTGNIISFQQTSGADRFIFDGTGVMTISQAVGTTYFTYATGFKIATASSQPIELQTAGATRLNIHGTTGDISIPSNKLSIGASTAAASSLLDVSSTTKGFLPPRMTGKQAEAISSPAEGLLIYSTDGSGATITSKGWWGYEGSTWVKLN